MIRWTISRNYDDIRISAPDEEGKPAVPGEIKVISKAEFDEMENREGAEDQKGRYAAFDLEGVEILFGEGTAENVAWRRREPGDHIRIKPASSKAGSAGEKVKLTLAPDKKDDFKRKKIQDILVDDKVPKDDRDLIYYAAIGKEVLFIPVQQGIARARWSAAYKVTKATKRVLLLTV